MTEIKELQKFVDSATKQIEMLSTVQMAIVEYLGKESHKFRNTVIASVLAKDEFRNDFSKYINTNDDVPDAVKLEMMELNELVDKAKKMLKEDDAELDK